LPTLTISWVSANDYSRRFLSCFVYLTLKEKLRSDAMINENKCKPRNNSEIGWQRNMLLAAPLIGWQRNMLLAAPLIMIDNWKNVKASNFNLI
jgi:hypothetical protein